MILLNIKKWWKNKEKISNKIASLKRTKKRDVPKELEEKYMI